MIYKITFSPTGGTLRVADAILSDMANVKEISLLSMDTVYKEMSFNPQDTCLFAVPAFGGRVPNHAASRISEMTGNGAKAILVAVYGNRAIDDTLIELKDLTENCGFLPIAAISAVAEHSVLRFVASGRPDHQDNRELQEFGRTIFSKIDDSHLPELSVPGNRPYKDYPAFPFKPVGDENCTKCSICASECPVGAIDPAHPQENRTEVCMSCMRCVAVCPVGARICAQAAKPPLPPQMEALFSGRKENQLFI